MFMICLSKRKKAYTRECLTRSSTTSNYPPPGMETRQRDIDTEIKERRCFRLSKNKPDYTIGKLFELTPLTIIPSEPNMYYYWRLFSFPRGMSLHRSKDRLQVGLHRATSFRNSLLTVRISITSSECIAESSASRCILTITVQFMLSCVQSLKSKNQSLSTDFLSKRKFYILL